MSSLTIISVIFQLSSTIVVADRPPNAFTQSLYELWCQENVRSNAWFLYPHRTPMGIQSTQNETSVIYHLVDDRHSGLFSVHSKRLAVFHFLLLNITRPLEINREYQDMYVLRVQATLTTPNQPTLVEQTEIHLHVADSNDNDGVFDMDTYEKTFDQPIDTTQALIRFHASDADEIHHGQLMYELGSSAISQIFSLHPFTGDLYLLSNESLQSDYQFDIYVYDRHRKNLINDRMKTKARVQLHFHQKKIRHRRRTIFNQIIEFQEEISSYQLNYSQRNSWTLLTVHQPILAIEVSPRIDSMEIFVLNTSSKNSIDLFTSANQIYADNVHLQEYHLHLLLCFSNRTKCQSASYHLIPSIDFSKFRFRFPSIPSLILPDDLPHHSFIHHLRLQYESITDDEPFLIHYHLLNSSSDFNLDPKTGVLRLGNGFNYRQYRLNIQAEISFLNQIYSLSTTVQIGVQETNKYRPVFHHETPREIHYVPHRFEAIDFDQNKSTNGRVSYRLWNCSVDCPFQIHPNNGILSRRRSIEFRRDRIYSLQIVAFDWGEPFRLDTTMDVRIDLSTKLTKRDLFNSDSASIVSKSDPWPLTIGFAQNITIYHLSEDTPVGTTIDLLDIKIGPLPSAIDQNKDRLFFLIIDDPSVPFIVDQTENKIRLISSLDREKVDHYTFTIELQLRPTSLLKLQSNEENHQRMLVRIHIDDVNDHIPRCSHFHRSISIYENELRTDFYRVQAIDPDLGENGTITYSLLNYQHYFTIDAQTGQIDLIRRIDREQLPHFRLYVIAADQGRPSSLHSICTTLHLTIIDRNDRIPQFSRIQYTYHLFDDLPRYAIFGQIHAIDADSTDQLIYSMEPNPYVTIDSRSGYLRLEENPMGTAINLSVNVSDGVHVNQTSIQIAVQASQEPQQPILVSEPALSVMVNRSTPVGTTIATIYDLFQVDRSSIDHMEILDEEERGSTPFSIDQQGIIRLRHRLIDSTIASYWLSVRLTRYHARPAHTFVHLHVSIEDDNFYVPQCVDLYQSFKLYEYSIPHLVVRVQAISSHWPADLHYSLITDDIHENVFSVSSSTGHVDVLPSFRTSPSTLSRYFLTVRASDRQQHTSVDCFLDIQLIRRRQLTPKFLHPSGYNLDLLEITSESGRLRQRLFQVIALLDEQVYASDLEVRYRVVDSPEHFLINPQTGYIAAKQALLAQSTYDLFIEAFTVAHRADENIDQKEKWRIVSSRVVLLIKIRILPSASVDRPWIAALNSTIRLDLSSTAQVGSTMVHFGSEDSLSRWYILISDVEHTRYFHVDVRSGHLMLIRPINELMNTMPIVRLRVNVTQNWTDMETIEIIVHLVNTTLPVVRFAKADCYTTVSKNVSVGAEIARLTVDHPARDCLYKIHAVKRIQSKDLFRIDSHSGSILMAHSLENTLDEKHLLSVIYHCPNNSQLAHTRLHITLRKSEPTNTRTGELDRFTQEHYLVLFETSLSVNQTKALLNLTLINNHRDRRRTKPNAHIIKGDPLGLFSIDSSTQSLTLLDESRARSYTYPIHLTVLDISHTEPITCMVTVMISNIAVKVTCPSSSQSSSLYLPTYSSSPSGAVDSLSGERYTYLDSLRMRVFDPLSSSHLAECVSPVVKDRKTEEQRKEIDFVFEQQTYSGYANHSFKYIYRREEPMHLAIQYRELYLDPFAVTYQFVLPHKAPDSFDLDPHAGIIHYFPRHDMNSSIRYSLIVLARYHSFITLVRLNIVLHPEQMHHPRTSYRFSLIIPSVNNYTVGHLEASEGNWTVLNSEIRTMFAIDAHGRLFVANRTFISTEEKHLFAFFVQDQFLRFIRIEIILRAKQLVQCVLNRFPSLGDEKLLLGFVEIFQPEHPIAVRYDSFTRKSFSLLNYNHLFELDRDHGLLSYRNAARTMSTEIELLIEIDNVRCLIALNGLARPSYLMIRSGSRLHAQLQQQMHSAKTSGSIHLVNGTSFHFDLVSDHAPIFSQKSYIFSLHLSDYKKQRWFVGRVIAQPYHLTRSHLVYQFVSAKRNFLLDLDHGTIEYLSVPSYNGTIEYMQIIARDLVYEQNTTINITIHIVRSEHLFPLSMIHWHQTFSPMLPPGSIIFRFNQSTTDDDRYSLEDARQNLFTIDSASGVISSLDFLPDAFYTLKIRLSPQEHLFILHLSALRYNQHPPLFVNLPLNLSVSSEATFVTKLFATDPDLNHHQTLEYYLTDLDEQEIVTVDRYTGIVNLQRTLPRGSLLLNVAVSDGCYITKDQLRLTIEDYSSAAPTFSSDEYTFQYNDLRGQILAQDSDLNDRILYRLHLEPDGVEIDRYSGWITIERNLSSLIEESTIEFYASATDRVQQIAYTTIRIVLPVHPQFSANLYFLSLTLPVQIPSEIFQFELVNAFNQPLSSSRFALDQTHLFQIDADKLILKKHLDSSKIYYLNIYGYWKHFSLQSSLRIVLVDHAISFERSLYDFRLDSAVLKPQDIIKTFTLPNATLKILSTPLTRNDCIRNFYIKENALVFHQYPIRSHLCLFEIQAANQNSIATSQIQVSLIQSLGVPRFSSTRYSFYPRSSRNIFRVFARGSHSLRYSLQVNPYGLNIHSTTGVLSFDGDFDTVNRVASVQLTVHAHDVDTHENASATVHVSFRRRRSLDVPRNRSAVPTCSNRSLVISDDSSPGTLIQSIGHNSYILSGDPYGLFTINDRGQLYLVSAKLKQTSERFFALLIVRSSFSIWYCRMNITVVRSIDWSSFMCPSMPIRWTIDEELPIGSVLGSVKQALSMINTDFKWMDSIDVKLVESNDTARFLLDSKTGILTSTARLDYEDNSIYLLSIVLEPERLNCSLVIIVQLLNLPDNPISFDQRSLIYTMDRKLPIPSYLGRIRLFDVDQLLSPDYRFYLRNHSTMISIDPTTGSILLTQRSHQKLYGSNSTYEILAINTNQQHTLAGLLVIDIRRSSAGVLTFENDHYRINVSRSMRPGSLVFQAVALTDDPVTQINITYSLIDGPDEFSLDKSTGLIHLNRYLPSSTTTYALMVEAKEEGTDLTAKTTVVVTLLDDQDPCFNVMNIRQCSLEWTAIIGTSICTLGNNAQECLYQLIDPMSYFALAGKSGMIISRNLFIDEITEHQYDVTLLAWDRRNQTSLLSSLNVTIRVRRHQEHASGNERTFLYLAYPSINATVHRIQTRGHDPSHFTYRILTTTSSFYRLVTSNHSIDVVLRQPIVHDREDQVTIRLWSPYSSSPSPATDIHLRFVYRRSHSDFPAVLPHRIDGYVNRDDTYSIINLGRLFVTDQTSYPLLHFHLPTNKHFFLKRSSVNHTALYMNSVSQEPTLKYSLNLTAVSTRTSISAFNFLHQTTVVLPSVAESYSLNVHLFPVDRSMVDQTIVLIFHIQPDLSHEHFIRNNLSLVHARISDILGVQSEDVHLYSFEFKRNSLELLLAVTNHSSMFTRRFIARDRVYSMLQGSSDTFDAILLDTCRSSTCNHNGRCQSSIELLSNRYDYFSYHKHRRLLPKYQWNMTCSCRDDRYGPRCQFKREGTSPCTSDDCPSMKTTFECINRNSPTCRDASRTRTFDGDSSVRINASSNSTEHLHLTLSFRTAFSHGKLIEVIYSDAATKIESLFSIQLIDGYVGIQLDGTILYQFYYILTNDSLWHDIFMSMDYAHHYLLLRLDHVFSHILYLSARIAAEKLLGIVSGDDFRGCIGNLTFNHQEVFSANGEQRYNPHFSVEDVGTVSGCLSTEVVAAANEKDDFCSLYRPCYHGGSCINLESSFICHCFQSRFTGNQCQYDLQPCDSYPCSSNEECVTRSTEGNRTFVCLTLSAESGSALIRKPLYLGLLMILLTCALSVLIAYCHTKRREQTSRNSQGLSEKSLPSSPSSSSSSATTSQPVQLLLKLNYNGQPSITTMKIRRKDQVRIGKVEYREDPCDDFVPPADNHTFVHYRTWEDNTTIPFDDSQIEDSLGFVSSPENHPIYHHSLSSVTDRHEVNSTPSLDPDSTMLYGQVPSIVSVPRLQAYARIVKTPKSSHHRTKAHEDLRSAGPFSSTPISSLESIHNELETDDFATPTTMQCEEYASRRNSPAASTQPFASSSPTQTEV